MSKMPSRWWGDLLGRCLVARESAGGTVSVTAAQAAAHRNQAEEYLRSARAALSLGDDNAAAGNAVNAGINAADAVAGANLGKRWRGPHEQAADFAAIAGVEGREVAKELRRLIPVKTLAHYDASPVSRTKAAAAVASAERAVAVARRVTSRFT